MPRHSTRVRSFTFASMCSHFDAQNTANGDRKGEAMARSLPRTVGLHHLPPALLFPMHGRANVGVAYRMVDRRQTLTIGQ